MSPTELVPGTPVVKTTVDEESFDKVRVETYTSIICDRNYYGPGCLTYCGVPLEGGTCDADGQLQCSSGFYLFEGSCKGRFEGLAQRLISLGADFMLARSPLCFLATHCQRANRGTIAVKTSVNRVRRDSFNRVEAPGAACAFTTTT